MSYCRFSSDNWRCDLYCYEDVGGGWTTHVASNRYAGDIPEVPELPRDGPADEWIAAHRAQSDWIRTADRAPIDLPYAGARFNDPDLESFLARVRMLRDAGLNVPTWVDDAILEELEADASRIRP